MLTIEWKNETENNVNSYKTSIKKAIESTLLAEKVKENIDISFVFVCDEQIRKINKKYRKKDKSTDVLSFPMIDYGEDKLYKNLPRSIKKEFINPSTSSILLGDIVVSLETIKRQAKDFGTTFKEELLLMVIHSTLHLLGYDHIVEDEKEVMFKKQNKILKGLNINEK